MIATSEKIKLGVLGERVDGRNGGTRQSEGRPLRRGAWDRWKGIAKTIGDFQARLLLGGFYFLVLGPFALLLRTTCDPLAIKRGATRGWHLRGPEAGVRVERAREQF